MIYLILLIIGISLVTWLWLHNLAVQRDYERISDMRNLQSRWLSYFAKYNTFEISHCQAGRLISSCGGGNGQVLDTTGLVDPLNQDQYRYVVEAVTQDDFSVSFYLETQIGNLLPGQYLLDSQGISIPTQS